MTIVDRQHAAQIVTEKGKAFKFDATECMMNHLNDIDRTEIALFLVNDYSNPGELIDATKAFYLISEGIPSPMGEYLTAFETKERVEAILLEHDGDQLSWEQLKLRFEY
jgi:copper chaperone NosL